MGCPFLPPSNSQIASTIVQLLAEAGIDNSVQRTREPRTCQGNTVKHHGLAFASQRFCMTDSHRTWIHHNSKNYIRILIFKKKLPIKKKCAWCTSDFSSSHKNFPYKNITEKIASLCLAWIWCLSLKYTLQELKKVLNKKEKQINYIYFKNVYCLMTT